MSRYSYILYAIYCLISYQGTSQNKVVEKSTYTYKDTLQLDFYKSVENFDEKAPLILLLHGGGFASGKRDGGQESKFCEDMANMGYPVASMSYHLTRKNDPFNCDCTTENKMASFVSASEDLSDALNFLQQKSDLIFNRTKTVLVGSSAGAETILHLIFMGYDYRFKHINPVKISGLISFSGAISNAAYISKANAVPTLMIHGKKDRLVPFSTAPHHFCSEEKSGYLMLDGPETIAKNLKKQNTSYWLAFHPEEGHNMADKAFNETSLIDRFIQELVIKKRFGQIKFQLKDPKANYQTEPINQ